MPKHLYRIIAFCLALSGLLASGMPVPAAELMTGAADVTKDGHIAVGGQTVRLYDITLPTADTACSEWSGRQDRRYPCHLHARAALKSLIGSDTVTCVPRRGQRATCYVRGHDIAEVLVSNGWAVSCGQSGRYLLGQESARKSRKGMWAGNFDLMGLCPGGAATPPSREP